MASINRIYNLDLKAFIEAWDAGRLYSNDLSAQVQASKEGNLNNLGNPVSAAAPVVTKNHPLFWEFIEQGVRDLTRKIVIDLNYITFSSCQGHPEYRSSGSVIAFRSRSLSILPRDKAEEKAIFKQLQRVCDQTNTAIASQHVMVEVETTRLEVLNHGYLKYWKCVELSFTPTVNATAPYFDVIEAVYQAFLQYLSESQ